MSNDERNPAFREQRRNPETTTWEQRPVAIAPFIVELAQSGWAVERTSNAGRTHRLRHHQHPGASLVVSWNGFSPLAQWYKPGKRGPSNQAHLAAGHHTHGFTPVQLVGWANKGAIE